jgi:hypothetical protein
VPGHIEQGSDHGRVDSSCRAGFGGRDALLDQPPKHGITRVLGNTETVRERQIREIEIAWAPAEHVSVERDDECLGPGFLSA